MIIGFKLFLLTLIFVSKVIQVEQEVEPELNIFICDADEHLLEPMEQIKYSLNEVQVTYGPIIKLRDAP